MTRLPSARRRKLHTVLGAVIIAVWCGCVLGSLWMVLAGLAEALR